ncbi:MAG: superoxide dismutase [Verrucomicrobia bacterium]|nr:superoxide dismutase [Verrucomicrobiota bacterium]
MKANASLQTVARVGERVPKITGNKAALSSLLALLLSCAGPALAEPQDKFPSIIPLPNGFRPEGIVIGRGTDFYAGSIGQGSIFKGDLRTGEGAILVPPQAGRAAHGLAYDKRTDYIYTAGGRTGAGFVYDAVTGGNVASFQFATEDTFINSVVITRTAAYFTDSFRPQLYRVPLSENGELPDPPEFETIALGGDFVSVPGTFNANGIEVTPDERWLLIVHSSLGALYRVDPATGVARQIALGDALVLNGDGILLEDETLFVVQNSFNQIAVIRMERDFAAGELERVITDPLLRIPTTLDAFGDALYAVNARFDVTPTPDTEYEVVRVLKE